MLILYFGPEVFMPLLSALAAAVGAVLIVGRRALDWVLSLGRRVAGLFGVSRESDDGRDATS